MSAAVLQAHFQHFLCGCGERILGIAGNHAAGMQGEQVGDVPVTRFGLLIGRIRPFGDAAVRRDGRTRDLLRHFVKSFAEFHILRIVDAERLCRRIDRLEQAQDDLTVHGRANAQAALCARGSPVCIFRGYAGTGHEAACRVLEEVVDEEESSFLHRFVMLLQEVCVSGKCIVFVDVET